MDNGKHGIIILGGGLAGLSAGCTLTRAGRSVKLFESDSIVGGLSKTIVREGFRFDLGGHRFVTKDPAVDAFVRELMDGELVSVPRSSKIYMRGKYFDYPLRPLNAMFGLGIPITAKIMADYGLEKAKRLFNQKPIASLEDWVVDNFGRTMFTIYFKEYSEKVWGIDCSRISAEWVAQRIRGLSLAKAVKNAFFKFSGKNLATLADSFLYPQLGIGRVADRLKEKIEKRNAVFTDANVTSVNRSGFTIGSVVVKNHMDSRVVEGEEFISSMPVTRLVRTLRPAAPRHILDAASKLRFRDLVVVAVMINRPRVTDQTWIYIPEQRIPFGRIHEPTNWSEKMAPAGKTLLVAEFFSYRGDQIWNQSDERLTEMTVGGLDQLGFIKKEEVINSVVVRVPKAYPLFEVGYRELCDVIYDYLGRFKNLHVTGRSGMFRYYNMDIAIKSGIDTAERILNREPAPSENKPEELVLAKN